MSELTLSLTAGEAAMLQAASEACQEESVMSWAKARLLAQAMVDIHQDGPLSWEALWADSKPPPEMRRDQ